MRYHIFRHHMPMVLEAFCYGDRTLLKEHPKMAQARIVVHFMARQKRFNKDEMWGMVDDYQVKSVNK
jgi:hypothetical protein